MSSLTLSSSNLIYLPNTIAEGMYKVLLPSEVTQVTDQEDALMTHIELLGLLGRLKGLSGVYSSVSFENSMACFGVYGCVMWSKVGGE